MDLYYGDHGYSTCVTVSWVSHKKAEKRGGGLFCQVFRNLLFIIMDSYYRDLSCCKSITKSFVM